MARSQTSQSIPIPSEDEMVEVALDTAESIEQIAVGSAVDILNRDCQQTDLFAPVKRKAWTHNDGRCNFKVNRKTVLKVDFSVTTIWERTVTGVLLKDIKKNENYVNIFAEALATEIKCQLGTNLKTQQFAVTHAPRRRHRDWNFGAEVAKQVASLLKLNVLIDLVTAKTAQRINEDNFTLQYEPTQDNIIIVDDILTTGATLTMMNKLLRLKYNTMCFVGIYNHRLNDGHADK